MDWNGQCCPLQHLPRSDELAPGLSSQEFVSISDFCFPWDPDNQSASHKLTCSDVMHVSYLVYIHYTVESSVTLPANYGISGLQVLIPKYSQSTPAIRLALVTACGITCSARRGLQCADAIWCRFHTSHLFLNALPLRLGAANFGGKTGSFDLIACFERNPPT